MQIKFQQIDLSPLLKLIRLSIKSSIVTLTFSLVSVFDFIPASNHIHLIVLAYCLFLAIVEPAILSVSYSLIKSLKS